MERAKMSRRSFVRGASAAAAGFITSSLGERAIASEGKSGNCIGAGFENLVKNGNINQSVSRWCYDKIPLEELCAAVKGMGLRAIDLLGPEDFGTLKKYGLICSMVHGPGGTINKKQHKEFSEKMREKIDLVAEAGYPNVITFAGKRGKIRDEEGLDNAMEALKLVVGQAEKKKVNICIEYLNSVIEIKDYMFDNMAWGVKLCDRVGSERLKILFDIYHVQVMEGDIIRKIRKFHQYIGHYHTGGNPGRNEIDETQELYYPAIMRAIVKTGYKGYVSHEFIPTRAPFTSLSEAIKICDV